MTTWLGFSQYSPPLRAFALKFVTFFRTEAVAQSRRRSSLLACCALLLTVGSPASAQDESWVKLSTLNATALAKTPALTQRALGGTLAAFREKWAAARPLVGAAGKPLPRRNTPIEPTIAWAELQANGNKIGLSLSDSNCDGPNSAAAPDLYICKATLSTADQKGDDYREKIVSVCYTGQNGDSANEIAYNKIKNMMDYRVIIPDVNTESCNRSFLLEKLGRDMPKFWIYVVRTFVRIGIIFALSTLATVALSGGLGVGQFNGDACLTLNSFQKLDHLNLKNSSRDFAAVSRYVEDQQQLVGIHNSCCTGLMQLNYVNLQNPKVCGCTAAEYGAYTQQQQIDVYQNYFQTLNTDYGMNQLKQMIAGHQTLGGYVVDGYTLVACAQMGTGNCDAAVRNACSSVAVGAGGDTHVNVCTMGDKARTAMASYNIFSTCVTPD